MLVQYIARVKQPNDTIERPFNNFALAKLWIDGFLQNNTIGEIEERKRNAYGLLIETNIRYFYPL